MNNLITEYNLIIEYNPDKGITIPDNQIQNFVDNIIYDIEHAKLKHEYYENIGSIVLLDAFRVAIKKGRLDHKQVIIRFGGKDYKLDKKGNIPYKVFNEMSKKQVK